MIRQWLPTKDEPQPPLVLDELRAAHDRRARMFTLLGESLDALLDSYESIPARGSRDGASLPEIDQFVGHAIAALHYQGRAGQLMDLSLNRLALARGSLKKLGGTPNNRLTTQLWGAGIATCADLS